MSPWCVCVCVRHGPQHGRTALLATTNNESGVGRFYNGVFVSSSDFAWLVCIKSPVLGLESRDCCLASCYCRCCCCCRFASLCHGTSRLMASNLTKLCIQPPINLFSQSVLSLVCHKICIISLRHII